MDGNFLPETLRGRLVEELRGEVPSGMGERIDDLISAVFDFHAHKPDETEAMQFDFRSLSGENLLPARDESFGVADFLKLSQTFERSMVGLILKSELTTDEKARFVDDVQSFFDNFDTALLGQFEEELVAKGLLRSVSDQVAVRRFLSFFGLSKELADELADPVILQVNDRIIYRNNPAEKFLGGELSGKPFCGPDGFIEVSGDESEDTGEWHHAGVSIPTGESVFTATPAAWRTVTSLEGLVTLIMLPGAIPLRSSMEQVDDLTRESRRFRLLYRLSTELAKGFDTEAIFRSLTGELSGAVGYEALMLHIIGPDHGRALFHFTVPASSDVPDMLWRSSIDTLRAFIPDIDDTRVEELVVNPEYIEIGSAPSPDGGDPRVPPGSVYVLPLFFEDEVLGSLGLRLHGTQWFSDEDLQLLTTFTNQLALALKNMTAVERMRRLLRDNREQIELARRVQHGLLPEPGEFRRLKFHTLFKPAASLSGDFYQFFSGAEMEGLIIGDASGHGISASLIMAVASAVFRDICTREICDPIDVLTKSNNYLKEALGDDFFVTALVFGIDPETLRASYATAGHPGPLLLKPDGKVRQLKAVGLPLGMFDDPLEYKLHSAKLHPGDRLLFFTDGAIEGHNVDGKLYGPKRLRSCLKANAHLAGGELLHAIASDISSFLADSQRADDMTLIVMEVTLSPFASVYIPK